jgi:high affinity Mn2+ porin
MRNRLLGVALALILVSTGLARAMADEVSDVAASEPSTAASTETSTTPGNAEQLWNFHLQTTAIVQGDPAFSAQYSGPNSLTNTGEVKDALSLDLFGGLRLWDGAEMHVDGFLWQGFGLTDSLGVEDFPNAAAAKAGTYTPAFSFTRLFIRQTIGLGGDQEDVADDQLTLAGKQDVSRITITLGRFTPADMFDANTYANNAATQFLNWAFVNNVAWDYPADAIGFTTGVSVELNQPNWTLRYGFFQMPSDSNFWTAEDGGILTYPAMSPAGDGKFWKSWGMPAELETRYKIKSHPGVLRLDAWVNQADMGSYSQALFEPGANILLTRAYRYKYGFGVNWEQEVADNVGIFSRLGWNDGKEEAWAYTDVNYSLSAGLSVNGTVWNRPNDTFGLAGVISGASTENQRFLEAGGTGILDGDGALTYGWEKVIETYYDIGFWQNIHFALDYQYVDNPAFNRDRGPVSIFAARIHWQM